MRYVMRVIEWLEATTSTGRTLSRRQALDMANFLRAEEAGVETRRTGYCGQPSSHAADCDCAGLMTPDDDD